MLGYFSVAVVRAPAVWLRSGLIDSFGRLEVRGEGRFGGGGGALVHRLGGEGGGPKLRVSTGRWSNLLVSLEVI